MTKQELLKTAKPILFNTDMVRAILDGRKTETRRVVKRLELELDVDGSIIGVNDRFEGRTFPIMNYAPYKRGDILYVRETWNYGYFDCSDFEYRANEYWFEELPRGTKTSLGDGHYVYRAELSEDDLNELEYKNEDGYRGISWHPSIHMPKEAARIFLRVTNVRVERLQDMIENPLQKGEKALFPVAINREGLIKPCSNCYHPNGECIDFLNKGECKLYKEIVSLWNSTIPKKDHDIYGWDANPWVWVIEFERIEVER